jgi:hypothetical protein
MIQSTYNLKGKTREVSPTYSNTQEDNIVINLLIIIHLVLSMQNNHLHS